MDSLLLSTNQAAQVLNLSLRTIENLLRKGELARRKVGRRTMIPRVSLEEFAAKKDATESSGKN
jgi:excisionase family DNA binding protein